MRNNLFEWHISYLQVLCKMEFSVLSTSWSYRFLNALDGWCSQYLGLVLAYCMNLGMKLSYIFILPTTYIFGNLALRLSEVWKFVTQFFLKFLKELSEKIIYLRGQDRSFGCSPSFKIASSRHLVKFYFSKYCSLSRASEVSCRCVTFCPSPERERTKLEIKILTLAPNVNVNI